jgi:hypothetical protein
VKKLVSKVCFFQILSLYRYSEARRTILLEQYIGQIEMEALTMVGLAVQVRECS